MMVQGVVILPNRHNSAAILQRDDAALVAVRPLQGEELYYLDRVCWNLAFPGGFTMLFDETTHQSMTIEVLRVAEGLTWEEKVDMLRLFKQ